MAERFATGSATKVELETAAGAAEGAYQDLFADYQADLTLRNRFLGMATSLAARVASHSAATGYYDELVKEVGDVNVIRGLHFGGRQDGRDEEMGQLLREIVGNPFRPVSLAPAWLTPAVLKLAQAAYDNRLLPSGLLDNGGLAVLADALEEAGCDHQDILSHLRGPGPHTRGCWVVDLILGKS
jgi:hypothetical protein